jgi:glycosidase
MGLTMSSPCWLNKSVIYQVLIDRFFCGEGAKERDCVPPDDQPVFCGGNLQGVAEKLDYLEELGITALWLSPFARTASYHGYHTTDFFAVEDHFGGFAGLYKLVRAARARGIRLIMDFVPNHVHETHPWFLDAKNSPHSHYRDWFYWLRHGDYLKFLNFAELPKLNLDHPEARETLIQAAQFWLDQGIDGFRLDHVIGPSLDFWIEFRRRLKEHRSDTVLFGEAYFWGIPPGCLSTLCLPHKWKYLLMQQLGIDVFDATMREYVEVFDGLLDFTFQKILKTEVALARQKQSDAYIQDKLDSHYSRFPEQCALLSFLDNHDMDRFLFNAGGDKARLLRALEIQFKQKSTPILYYGTETGMSQKAPARGYHGDLQVRRMMDWDHPDPQIGRACRNLIQEWKSRP